MSTEVRAGCGVIASSCADPPSVVAARQLAEEAHERRRQPRRPRSVRYRPRSHQPRGPRPDPAETVAGRFLVERDRHVDG